MAKTKILIIDDDRLIRWSLRQKLGEWVARRDRGRERGRRPAARPGGIARSRAAGHEAARRTGHGFPGRDPPGFADLPVIMITAFGIIEDVVTAMRRGAYDFVTKPFDDPKLQSTLQHALEAAALKRKISTYREIDEKKFAPGPIIGGTPIMLRVLDMAAPGGRERGGHRPSPRRKRDGQGPGRPDHPRLEPPQGAPRSWPSIVRPSRRRSWRASSSAMKKGPSPTPSSRSTA